MQKLDFLYKEGEKCSHPAGKNTADFRQIRYTLKSGAG
jgi:hypothetical protein